jgi:hypothetical protein
MPNERLSNLVRRIDEELGATGREPLQWVGPASAAAIERVERTLGCRLPRSFREFLQMTGGGGLAHFWVSGASDENGGGSVVCDTQVYREDFGLPAHLVVIQKDPDDNEPFCLDTSRFDGGECPVVLYYFTSGKTEHVADDFASFYEKYLEPYFADEA